MIPPCQLITLIFASAAVLFRKLILAVNVAGLGNIRTSVSEFLMVTVLISLNFVPPELIILSR